MRREPRQIDLFTPAQDEVKGLRATEPGSPVRPGEKYVEGRSVGATTSVVEEATDAAGQSRVIVDAADQLLANLSLFS